MNTVIKLFIFSMLLNVVYGCHNSTKNSESSQAIEQTDSCLSNPAHSYEVFIANNAKSNHELPLIVAIDPHGSGKTTIDHLKEAATTYPAVLVASNLIQNNDRNYIHELDELIADAKSRYPIGNTIYLIGFSGGARMALEYATNHTVEGVIACGAFTGPKQLSAIKCPVMGLIGMDDFNFLETVQYLFNPKSMPSNAHIELSKNSHAWPIKDMLTNIFGWFQLSRASDKTYNKKQLIQYTKKQQVLIDSLIESDNLLQAACIDRNMASIEVFEEIGSFRSKTNKLTNKVAYKTQISQLQESLQFEVKARQKYGQALLEKDGDWWKNEISVLHEKMSSEPNNMKRMAYNRLNGFLGIVCYSYSSRFAAQKDLQQLNKILTVYRLVEPKNTDMLHFSEILEQIKAQQ